MKKLLTITTLFFPALLFAQQKTGGFIKEHLFVKASPTLFIPVHGNLTPAALGTIGLKYNKYIALGISGGYFTYNQETKTVIPWGAELTVTNFKAQKIAPILTVQLFRPANYEKTEAANWQTPYTNSVGGISYEDHNENVHTTGKSLFSVAAGALIPICSHKLAFTAGFSQLTFKKDIFKGWYNPSLGRGVKDSQVTFQNILMANISLSFIF
ncbi:hypothetical protein Niako_5605 [Niastella koreensis GR20-10]|uniref:Outer membrane protein beta-barrel domain-containing protein n=1 Tax=Niastella koreensis (strain DSM 17620 / KACC 11465 / NBRC 106392 / GR20-10) TaxID=700598 RepID=G8TJT9_NIAKG|nr:hypothetical protein [Niastella koreensis]AEW01837.1 hypothetical protein Niako_5605 [Niastella koreensis GR20-10]